MSSVFSLAVQHVISFQPGGSHRTGARLCTGNRFPNIVWATGPGHILELASDTQKNLLGDGTASSWLDMSTCGPLYTPEGVKTSLTSST